MDRVDGMPMLFPLVEENDRWENDRWMEVRKVGVRWFEQGASIDGGGE
jgi:hypothetical protein